MTPPEVGYLRSAIRKHIEVFFEPSALAAFDDADIRWTTFSEASATGSSAIVVPIDISSSDTPKEPWKVDFSGTQLTLWNPAPDPGGAWTIDDPKQPLWYTHPSGSRMPAWNLAQTLFSLMVLREETTTAQRDQHGRFVGRMSPRAQRDLLSAPIFNDSVAALVAACLSMDGVPARTLSGVVRRPILVLSHDLDQLRGNDFWTQMVRVFRSVRPIFRLRPPALRHLWYVLVNAFRPRRYYLDNIRGMIEVERMLGFSSTYYFLNGTGGRFGARSGSGLIPLVATLIPVNSRIGMHYNYDTYLDRSRFDSQREELEALCGLRCDTGRAHYLRFDPAMSWEFLSAAGIRSDESLGYPDCVGYRAGIAAPFQPYNPAVEEAFPLLEMPLVVMDSTFVERYGPGSVGAFEKLFGHLKCVGGALSLLFHPGLFHNPEHPEMSGLYRRLLAAARDLGAVSKTLDELRLSYLGKS